METSHTVYGNPISRNSKSESILKKPSLYAERSLSYSLVIGAAAFASFIALHIFAPFFGPFGIFLAKKVLDVLIYDENNKNNKNRSKITFHNRYCDIEPLRDDNETHKNPRRDERSRGKKGENSKKKEESKREEHSKSTEANNEFETEAVSLETKASELKKDNQKEEAFNALKTEKKN